MNFLTKSAKSKFLFIVLFLCTLGKLPAQFTIPSKPKLQTSLYDYAHILKESNKKYLEQKLINYSDSTSTQIVVITTPTIKGDDINLVGAEWGEKWGIGQKGKDNGILILIARDDRKMTIQNGYGIESDLTDALSRYVIENEFTPYFKKGDYFAGIDKGTDAIFKILAGKYNADPKKEQGKGSIPLPVIFIIVVVLIIIFSRFGGGDSGKGGYRQSTPFLPIILAGSGRSTWGSSGGGFGGGGFGGGFGGGGFGGGGASGGW